MRYLQNIRPKPYINFQHGRKINEKTKIFHNLNFTF